MSYQTNSKRSPPFWLLIGARKLVFFCFSGTNQKPERRRSFGTGLVRHCPQGLFSPFFTFLCSIYIFRPFRLSLAPFICPWVSEDAYDGEWTLSNFQMAYRRFRVCFVIFPTWLKGLVIPLESLWDYEGGCCSKVVQDVKFYWVIGKQAVWWKNDFARKWQCMRATIGQNS